MQGRWALGRGTVLLQSSLVSSSDADEKEITGQGGLCKVVQKLESVVQSCILSGRDKGVVHGVASWATSY